MLYKDNKVYLVISPNDGQFKSIQKLYHEYRLIQVTEEKDLLGFNPKIKVLLNLDPFKQNPIWKDKVACERIRIMTDDK